MDSVSLAFAGLVVLVATTVTWFRRANRVAIPKNRSLFILCWALAAVIGGIAFVMPDAGWLSRIVGGLAALGGGLLLVLMALGGQRADEAIAVGDVIPAFSAPDHQGETFTSADLTGSHTLLKFFRGHW